MMLLSGGHLRWPSKTEFNGDQRLANAHQNRAGPLRHFSPCKLRPLACPPKPGALLHGAPRTNEDKRQSARALARHGLAGDIVI
jgi:hypothetical protein